VGLKPVWPRAGDGGQHEQDEADGELIEQRLGGRFAREAGEPHGDRGGGPGDARPQRKEIAPEHGGELPGRLLAAEEGDDDAAEGQRDAEPLQGSQPLGRQFPVQAEGDEDRRGVEEHHHVRGRGEAQAFADEQEFQREQETNEQAGAPRAITDADALAAPGHEQADQHGRNTRAQGDLHQGCDVRRRGLEHDLLQAPDEAQDEHDGHGLPIECLAAIHAGILLSRNE
jgi:hypothetical protein